MAAGSLDQLRDAGGQGCALAGDAGAGYEVDETRGVARDQLQAPFRAGGSGEENSIQVAAAQFGDWLGRLFDTEIGEQHAVDSSLAGIGCQALKPIAEQGIHIAEQEQGDLGLAANLADGSEQARQIHAGAEGAVRGALDHRTVGDGIREGKSEFDEIGASALEGQDEFGSSMGMGIASSKVSNERSTPLLFRAQK